ncbi:MAG: type II secretion system protein [Planctomycetaceae bacterium]
MPRRARQRGFTLLEIMIAMSILVIGATSILGIFVVAVDWQSRRVENNRVADIINFAIAHAEIAFNTFDPSSVPKGQSPVPPSIVVDLRDPDKARQNPDPQVQLAARRFPGCKYELVFERNPVGTGDSSVAVNVRIWGLPGVKDDPAYTDKIIFTRSGTPVHAFLNSPSLKAREDEKARGTTGRPR